MKFKFLAEYDLKLTEEANAPEVKKDDKLFKKPEGKAMYQKQRDDADDAEVEPIPPPP